MFTNKLFVFVIKFVVGLSNVEVDKSTNNVATTASSKENATKKMEENVNNNGKNHVG